jgi:hypothetical protein
MSLKIQRKKKMVDLNKRLFGTIKGLFMTLGNPKCHKMSLKVPRKNPLSGICSATWEQETICNCINDKVNEKYKTI